MKKISSLLSVLAGVLLFAQTTPLVIHNYSSYHAVGRLHTGPPGGIGSLYMMAAPNPPFGTFTVPSGEDTQYNKFNTSGTANLPIMKWYVTDYNNPNNNGTYNYNDNFITNVMNPSNEWAGFHFWLVNPATGNTVDTYELGDPTVYPAFSNSLTGAFSSADWYTITTPTGAITFLEIYDL